MHSFTAVGWSMQPEVLRLLNAWAHMMALQAKELAAKPDQFSAWNQLSGRKEPTPARWPVLIPWKEHTHIPTQ